MNESGSQPRSFIFTQQLQDEWNRCYRADCDERPADRSPLLSGELFRKQQVPTGFAEIVSNDLPVITTAQVLRAN
jgi:hypothetical protein